MATKKTTPAENTVVETKAVETKVAEEVKTEAPKAAEKKAPAKKETAKKPAAKKTTKAAEKKAPAKKAPAKKEAAPKKEAAKKAPKKKGLAYEDVVEAAKKKMAAADLTRIKYPIAANVELNGAADGIFYIYVDEANNISVEPYKYNDYDVEFRADADAFVAVMNGKKNIYDALAEGLVKVSGNVKKAILLINAAL
ncbi:MAG: SCP2 sterol-binding domain-containing protein [Oscillospiraceae bacterium]|nr:SCP2 sterol-binding domain-containing protein [Oscillospiraceae bacterium]